MTTPRPRPVLTASQKERHNQLRRERRARLRAQGLTIEGQPRSVQRRSKYGEGIRQPIYGTGPWRTIYTADVAAERARAQAQGLKWYGNGGRVTVEAYGA